MPDIVVCSLADLAKTAHRHGASHMTTLINARTPVERPATIPAEKHLLLEFNDIASAIPGLTPPGRHHVERLFEFVREWDRKAPMIVHCYAGISRSTAAAYSAVLALEPYRDEFELAWELRTLSPSATPNPRIVAFADDILGRGGRMIDAIAEIGRGADAFQGDPFRIELARA